MNASRGFTLIELLMVVLVIGILATVGIPQYNDYAVRSKIPEATSALSDGRIKMEQFFQDNRTYAGAPTPTATSSFTFAFVGTPNATTYVLEATGSGRVAGFKYRIDQNNTKSTFTAPTGWAAATMPTNCWILRRGGVC